MTVTLETLLLAIACIFMAVEIGRLKAKLQEVDDFAQDLDEGMAEIWAENEEIAKGFVSAGHQFDAIYERIMDAEESINKAHEGIQYLAKGDSL
jgi:hypothetical protein